MKVSLADVLLERLKELSIFFCVSCNPSLVDGFSCLAVHGYKLMGVLDLTVRRCEMAGLCLNLVALLLLGRVTLLFVPWRWYLWYVLLNSLLWALLVWTPQCPL